MATTVIAAFNEFMKDTVNLEKADTDDARASRDWLIGKINDFENDEVFPVSYPGIHIAFGSFARRTKIRPLDDIDLMFGLTGQGATYTILSDRVTVTSSGEGSRLHRYRHSGADTVCSVRILNAFKSRLQDVAQYAQADIRRNQEAVTLKLVSKDWNFDIVPCFITSEDAFGRTGTVAKLAMRQPFVLFKGLTFQKLCLPGAFRPGDHHNKMLRPGLCVVHASPQYL